jgi:spore germination protein
LFLSISSVHAEEFIYAGWIPRWSVESGYTSIKKNRHILGEISPMWYKVNTDGSLYSYRFSNAGSYKKLARDNGILLIPTVAMFDYKILNEVFSTQENFDRHIVSILYEVEKYGYDGIDLDYESMLVEDKAKFFEFLEILSAKLHEKNKKLYVTVLSKWGNMSYGALPQTREVQDWNRIEKYADVIRIMAYDYTYSGSTHPGPIGPLSWHKKILDYAVDELPEEKIQMGIHLYAYQWERPATDDFFEKEITELIAERNFKNIGSYVNKGAERILEENEGGQIDEYEGENFYRYQLDGKDRVLVYLDSKNLSKRNELAKSYGIRGVSYWSFGGDDNLLTDSVLVELQNEELEADSQSKTEKKNKKQFLVSVADIVSIQAASVLGATTK